MFPRFADFKAFFANMSYYLGRKAERPRFGMFDYTQKVEYWALIWGTLVMAVTGFVLWFPTLATELAASLGCQDMRDGPLL